jgi:6,7-dimethyl-8-ribityllumazine synthase
MKIAIVCSKFNGEITSKMLKAALLRAKTRGVGVVSVLFVPGAFDSPLAVKKLLKRKDVSAVAVLGAIVTGGTKHDEVIGFAIANSLSLLSMEFEKPVALGVIGPGVSESQAKARAVEYAGRAVDAAIDLVGVLK